jgi:hypothetical protein
MPDSRCLNTERGVQQSFSKSGLFNGLLVGLAVVAAHVGLDALPDRQPRASARAAIHFAAVAIDPTGVAPLRVAGAWRLTSPEPRMGGVSALALDRGGFLALSDSGAPIRFPRPDASGAVGLFTDLPSGPGSALQKAGRDSESLTRDWAGRGYWVGFENRHSAWLFDPGFRRALKRIDLAGLGWPANKGAEGAVSTSRGLLLYPEAGNEVVRLGDGGLSRLPLANSFGRLSDAAALPDGRILLIARTYGPMGFSARLLLLDVSMRARSLAPLNFGRLDNPEALAVEPLRGGGVRLWVMTDNDFRRRVPTLLVALDWRD